MDLNQSAGRYKGSGGSGNALDMHESAVNKGLAQEDPLMSKVVETPHGIVHFSKSAPGLELRHQSSGTSQEFKQNLLITPRQSMPCIKEQHLDVIRETEEDDEGGKLSISGRVKKDRQSKPVTKGSKVGPIKEETTAETGMVVENTSAGDCAHPNVLKSEDILEEPTECACSEEKHCSIEKSLESVCIADDTEDTVNLTSSETKDKKPKVLKDRLRSGLAGFGRRIRSFACVCSISKVNNPEEKQSMVDFVDITETEPEPQKENEN